MSPLFLGLVIAGARWLTRAHACVCVLLLVGLTGCAQVSVSRINATEPPSYALQGPHLAALLQEVAARCPKGHDVHRQAEITAGLQADWAGGRWWNLAMTRMADDDRQAQLVVTCR
jgi:hypothetical protein